MPIVSFLVGPQLPDVYVQEIASPPTIIGQPVGTVALVGTFQQGIPGCIYSISDYQTAVRLLGPSSASVGGPMALQNLLRQKCGNIQAVPVFGSGAAAASVTLLDAQTTPGTLGTITAAQQNPQSGSMAQMFGNYPNNWTVTVSQPSTPNGTFNLTINAGTVTERYQGVTPANWAATVNAASQVAIVTQPSTPSSNVAAAGAFSLTGGACGTLTAGSATDTAIVGSVGGGGAATGLALLGTLAPNSIQFVLAAEYSSATVNAALAGLANSILCIAIVCGPSAQTVSQLQALQVYAQDNVVYVDNWTTCYDADQGANRLCAPNALLAGMVSQQGPNQDFGNKQISSTLGLPVQRSRNDMLTLQESGILSLANVIPRGGFGSRNGIASNGSGAYIRRMRYFLEFSIMNAMGWAVGQPQTINANDPLRAQVAQVISTFLNGLASPLNAANQIIAGFSVVCDTTNNSAAQIQANLLNVNVTVQLQAPANVILISANISPTAGLTAQSSLQ